MSIITVLRFLITHFRFCISSAVPGVPPRSLWIRSRQPMGQQPADRLRLSSAIGSGRDVRNSLRLQTLRRERLVVLQSVSGWRDAHLSHTHTSSNAVRSVSGPLSDRTLRAGRERADRPRGLVGEHSFCAVSYQSSSTQRRRVWVQSASSSFSRWDEEQSHLYTKQRCNTVFKKIKKSSEDMWGKNLYFSTELLFIIFEVFRHLTVGALGLILHMMCSKHHYLFILILSHFSLF